MICISLVHGLMSQWIQLSMMVSRDYFWLRVTKNYNNFCGNLRERTLNQVKSQWQKINASVQRFKGHYKQAVDLKKSGYIENDVMINAYAIWKEDE